ncbi:MAG: hypothetical protein AB1394_16590, partial [Bacteroidota bacterium]
MRLKLNLISKKGLSEIPANYNYFLSAAIYKLLRFGSPEFSSFLHDRGFVLNGKPYKLFTFALRFKKIQMEFDKIKLISPEAELFISSPLIENFIQNFVIGTFQVQSIEISNGSIKSSFDIISVESIPPPVFRRINYFRLLSPIVLSSKKVENGKLTQQYFRYYHDLS